MNCNIIKNILKDFIYTVQSFISIIRFSRKVYIPKNEDANKEVCVFGNGPSLEESISEDIEYFKKRDVMCVNAFALTEYFKKIQPKYYLLLDSAYWVDDVKESLIMMRKNIYNVFNKDVAWDMCLFVPVSSRKVQWNVIINNNLIKIYFYNNTPVSGFKNIAHCLYYKNCGMPKASNVLIPAILCSLNMSYKYVDVYGADHSWHEDMVVNKNNVLCIKDRHFYDEKNEVVIPWQKGDKSCQTWKVHEILYTLSTVFKSYFVLKDYAKFMGAIVVNRSKKTSIDAFDRV